MTVIHTSTRSSLGLSATAPAAVTSYTANITVEGSPIAIPATITDGTDGNDTFTPAANALYAFGFGGDDIISNSGSTAVLLGGAGNDTFVIANNSSVATLPDGTILDFEVGSDLIDLSAFNVGFSDLTITPNSSGVAGSYAQITSTAANLNLNVSSTGGLHQLTSSSFIFNGTVGTSTPTEPTTPTTTTPTTSSGVTLPSFVLPILAELAAEAGGLTLTNSAGATSVTGGDLGDYISGAASELAETFFGAGGIDDIVAGAGNDIVYGGSGRVDASDSGDYIYGGSGADLLFGNGGDDIIIGGSELTDPTNDSGDSLIGGSGNDSLFGNGGNDTLWGQVGNDTLHGGVGDDNYVFGGGDGVDVIASFEGAGVAGGDIISVLAGINGTAIDTAAEVLAATTYENGGAIIDFGNGNSVQVLGVTSLIESDIQIVTDLGLPV